LKNTTSNLLGNGYIDLIIEKESSLNLIGEFTKLPIAIERVTWWCHYTAETKLKYGCPHGMGGPLNQYGEGMFSECVQYPDFALFEMSNPIDENSMTPAALAEKCNELVSDYIKNILPTESFYSPCLYVGLWAHVPDDWKRKYYWA
jgi:hypothetical protein